MVYQRHQNEQYQRINATTYFSGAFLHRTIFLEGNCSMNELIQAKFTNFLKQFGHITIIFYRLLSFLRKR